MLFLGGVEDTKQGREVLWGKEKEGGGATVHIGMKCGKAAGAGQEAAVQEASRPRHTRVETRQGRLGWFAQRSTKAEGGVRWEGQGKKTSTTKMGERGAQG